MMEKISEVAYCGVYCPNCGERCTLPERASALTDGMKEGEYDEWAHGLEGFTTFWKFLNGMVDQQEVKSCRNENCGYPPCGIRKCAKSRGVDVCPQCADYPCEMIQVFSNSEPTLIFDGTRMKAIGLPQWINEQDARRSKGFSYGMVRCGKGTIPEG